MIRSGVMSPNIGWRLSYSMNWETLFEQAMQRNDTGFWTLNNWHLESPPREKMSYKTDLCPNEYFQSYVQFFNQEENHY